VQLAVGLLERLIHRGGAGLEVDIGPAQAEQFTAAHPRANGEQQGHVERCALGVAQHLGGLLLV
jgi:hypothetical protein